MNEHVFSFSALSLCWANVLAIRLSTARHTEAMDRILWLEEERNVERKKENKRLEKRFFVFLSSQNISNFICGWWNFGS